MEYTCAKMKQLLDIRLIPLLLLTVMASCSHTPEFLAATFPDRGDDRIHMLYPTEIYFDEIKACADIADPETMSEYGFLLGETYDFDPQSARVIPAQWMEDERFYAYIDGLQTATKYYVRAYARQQDGTPLYDRVFAFTTSADESLRYVTVETAEDRLPDLTARSARIAGLVTDLGGDERLYEYGVDYWPADNASDVTSVRIQPAEGEDIGVGEIFTVDVGPLSSDTEYQARVCARNIRKIQYSEPFSFHTMVVEEPEVAIAESAADLGSTFITVRGEILSFGNDPYSEYGFYVGESPESLSDRRPCDESVPAEDGTRTFESMLRNLTPETQYYVQAYVRNEAFESRSEVLGPIQTLEPGIVVVETPPVTDNRNLSLTSATLRGIILSDGGIPLTAYGIRYGTDRDNLTEQVTGDAYDPLSGEFFVNLTSLQPSTTYYYRVFAANSVSEDEGDLQEFRTGVDGGYLWYADQSTNPATIRQSTTERLVYYELPVMEVEVQDLKTGSRRPAKVHLLDRNLGARSLAPDYRIPTGYSINEQLAWMAEYCGYYYHFNSLEPARTYWVKRSGASELSTALSTDVSNGTNVVTYLGWTTLSSVLEDRWTDESNPCPPGYRVPTVDEWQAIGRYVAAQGSANGSIGDVYRATGLSFGGFVALNGTIGKTVTTEGTVASNLFLSEVWSSTMKKDDPYRTVTTTENRIPSLPVPGSGTWTIDSSTSDVVYTFASSDNTFVMTECGRPYMLDINWMKDPSSTAVYQAVDYYDPYLAYGVYQRSGKYAANIRCVRVEY